MGDNPFETLGLDPYQTYEDKDITDQFHRLAEEVDQSNLNPADKARKQFLITQASRKLRTQEQRMHWVTAQITDEEINLINNARAEMKAQGESPDTYYQMYLNRLEEEKRNLAKDGWKGEALDVVRERFRPVERVFFEMLFLANPRRWTILQELRINPKISARRIEARRLTRAQVNAETLVSIDHPIAQDTTAARYNLEFRRAGALRDDSEAWEFLTKLRAAEGDVDKIARLKRNLRADTFDPLTRDELFRRADEKIKNIAQNISTPEETIEFVSKITQGRSHFRAKELEGVLSALKLYPKFQARLRATGELSGPSVAADLLDPQALQEYLEQHPDSSRVAKVVRQPFTPTGVFLTLQQQLDQIQAMRKQFEADHQAALRKDYWRHTLRSLGYQVGTGTVGAGFGFIVVGPLGALAGALLGGVFGASAADSTHKEIYPRLLTEEEEDEATRLEMIRSRLIAQHQDLKHSVPGCDQGAALLKR